MNGSPESRKKKRKTKALLAGLVKELAVSGSEMILAIALVFVFALILLGILAVSFPKGTGLVSFYGDLVEGAELDSDLRLRGKTPEKIYVAVLDRVERRVRDRPADAFTWADAHEGMDLENYHTIQTLGRSGAEITFGDRGKLELGERSLVVIKQPEEQEGWRRRDASVVLLGGRVHGRIDPGDGRPPVLDLVVPGGTSEIRARGEAVTEFSVTTHEDESSTVCIHSGTAEINTPAGSRVVGPNEAVEFDVGGWIGDVLPIPDPPAMVAPRDGHAETYGNVVPRIRLHWEPQPKATEYRVVLARDASMEQPIYDGKVSAPQFVHGDLAPGRYHWRVSAIEDRVEGLPSPVRSFRLIRDLEPPALTVELPEEVLHERLVIQGRTEPGSELYIGDEIVPLDEQGAFRHSLSLARGLNMIVVEAIDAAGNGTYRSQYVTARF